MRTYTEEELVKFGEYLLSDERKEMLITPDAEKRVSDADIRNVFEY